MDSSNKVSMVCKRCGYTSLYRSDLLRHFKRKYPCKPLLADTPINTLYNEFISACNSTDKTYKCRICNKGFTAYQNRHRHEKLCRINNPKQVNQDPSVSLEEFEKLKKEMEELKNKIVHIGQSNVNNGNVYNTSINVSSNTHLRNFGSENMQAIPQEFIRNCFMNLDIRDLLENLHFDDNFPENQNVRLISLKNEIMELYKNDKWYATSLLQGMQELIKQACYIFRSFYYKNKKHVYDDVGDGVENLLDQLEELDNMNEKLIKPIKQELTALLFSKRTQIINT